MLEEDILTETRRIAYFFSSRERPLSPGDNLTSLEKVLLASASKHGLKLHRVSGLLRGQCQATAVNVYRLATEKTYADFFFEQKGAVNVLCLHTLPQFQGDFYALKDFVIRRFVPTVNEAGASKVVGFAIPNSRPVKGRDWRSDKRGEGTKLQALYARLGCDVDPRTGRVELISEPCEP